MTFKRISLPKPPETEAAASRERAIGGNAERSAQSLLARRDALAYQVELLDAQIDRFAFESICGGTDDTQDVENYDGTLGVTRAFVDQHEPRIGQLQWLDDLATRFNGPGESPGNVSGVRWGSGGLIANDTFITAGHCFDQSGGGWQRPSRNGAVIPSSEIATLMRVNFNYQVNGQTGQVRAGDPFPVTQLLEYRLGGHDFAIVRVGRNANNQLPGQIYGTLTVATADLTTANAMLAMIQHPSGRPKRIEAGPMRQNANGQISYDSLDTEGGSSGSPILSDAGEVVGVHTNGGCTAFSGFNFGLAIDTVRQNSNIVN